MFNRIISSIAALISRADTAAEKLLNKLYGLYNRLADKLDVALVKLDQMTKNLLRKYYRALDYLEKLFGILRKLLRVIFPILLLFVPPICGFFIVFLAYEIYLADSIVLGAMSTVLLLMLIASFRSKAEAAVAEVAASQTPLVMVAELENLSVGRKFVGTLIAIAMLILSAYLSIGLLIGLLIFIAEVIVLYALKWMYGPMATPEAPKSA